MTRKKLLSLLMAAMIIMGVIAPTVALAGSIAEPTNTNSVTLHKLLMTKEELGAWDSDAIEKGTAEQPGYNATQDTAGLNTILKALNKNEVKEIAGVFFAWQNEDGEWIDKEGNVVADENSKDILGGLTEAGGIKFDTSKLPAGKYKIVEVKEKSTYQNDGNILTDSKAVPVELTLPLVNENGIVVDAHVYPKNTEEKPDIVKGFDDGTDTPSVPKDPEQHQIGDSIPYLVKTTIPAKSDYKALKWSDRMSKGLTYNNDLKVYIGTKELVKGTDYTVFEAGNGFDLKFTDEGLKNVNKQEQDVVVTLKYSATLNEDAAIAEPETNDIKLKYGHTPLFDSTPKEGKPSNKQIKIEKTWEGGTAPEGVVAIFDVVEKESGKLVATVELNAANNWTATVGNLDDAKTYIVIERMISGYEPEYVSFEGGVAKVNNKKDGNPKVINPEEPKVITYGAKFVKTDDADIATAKKLAGAQFVIKNAEGQFLMLKDKETQDANLTAYNNAEQAYQDAVKAYNVAAAKTNPPATAEELANLETAIKTAKETRDAAFEKMNMLWDWTTDKDEKKAMVFTSDRDGKFEVRGLKKGDYFLKEIKAPDGYALLQNEIKFNVNETSYEEANRIQVKNKKVTIPQTGGIGTVIFTVAGVTIMGGALFAMRKRRQEEF